MTLYSTLLFPVSRSTCFGHIPCPSSGAQLTVFTASAVDSVCPAVVVDESELIRWSTPDVVNTVN
jgi:hypothetical protein